MKLTYTVNVNRFGYCYTVQDEQGNDLAFAGGFLCADIADLEATAAMLRIKRAAMADRDPPIVGSDLKGIRFR